MTKKTIGLVTNSQSDFSAILDKANVHVEVVKPEDVGNYNVQSWHSMAIIGGCSDQPLLFRPRDRVIIEKFIHSGKPVFSEYCGSIGNIYFAEPESTRFEKLVFLGGDGSFGDLQKGDLLEDQCNMRLKPFDFSGSTRKPLLQYIRGKDHYSTIIGDEPFQELSDKALWFDVPDNLLICNFRIANFVKARFSPAGRWRVLVKQILKWLCAENIDTDVLDAAYRLQTFDTTAPLEGQVESTVSRALGWFEKAGILLEHGQEGVMEGLGTEIYPDGRQRVITGVRNDCTAETSLAFFLYSLMNKDDKSKDISDNLISVCFDYLQYKEDGPLKGMLRWTQTAWGACYQDDAARVLIPQLLKCFYTGSRAYLPECIEALNFLVSTTGTDGLRVFRTDNINLTEDKIRELAAKPANFLSAHYNAFYLGSLLLAYKVTGIEKFRDVGVSGLETLMAAYPHTKREYSETQELCRLIMPLSWLYWVTGESKHKEWLYRVTEDLKRFKHPSGGYLEWDTGYEADILESLESSLLTKNGDPVVDMLYSLNWLPMGFIQAYFVTQDTYFKQLWEEIAKFFVSVQIRSDNFMIDGTWTRALDVDLMEVYGTAADAGWGPWAIESGWTVAEIASGLISGRISDDLLPFYRA